LEAVPFLLPVFASSLFSYIPWLAISGPGAFKVQRFKVQRFKVQRFKVQRFKVQRFKVQRFKVQGSRFNGSRFSGSRFSGSKFKGPLSCRLPFRLDGCWFGEPGVARRAQPRAK